MSAEHLHSPESLIGQPSKDVIVWLAKEYPEIEIFSFVFYERREKDPPELEEKIRSGPSDIFLELSREEVLSGGLDYLLERFEPELSLGVNSNVVFKDGRLGQIPMMDFNCEINEKNAELISRLMTMIDLQCFLAISGVSYHSIAKEIVIEDQRKWEQFLGKCLLSGLADARYIGHSLKRGFSTLRISSSVVRPNEPRVVDFIL